MNPLLDYVSVILSINPFPEGMALPKPNGYKKTGYRRLFAVPRGINLYLKNSISCPSR